MPNYLAPYHVIDACAVTDGMGLYEIKLLSLQQAQ